MRKKVIAILITAFVFTFSVGAERRSIRRDPIDWEGQGFQKLKTTAYCMGHHTANGSAVHEGGCAFSPDHIGDVAIVYTIDGEYLGIFEVNDTAGEDSAVTAGYVLDIYRTDLERCQEWMDNTGGFIFVKFVKGKG